MTSMLVRGWTRWMMFPTSAEADIALVSRQELIANRHEWVNRVFIVLVLGIQQCGSLHSVRTRIAESTLSVWLLVTTRWLEVTGSGGACKAKIHPAFLGEEKRSSLAIKMPL